MIRDNLGEEEEGSPEERKEEGGKGRRLEKGGLGKSGGGWGRGGRKGRAPPRADQLSAFPTEGEITLRGENSILGNVQVCPGG